MFSIKWFSSLWIKTDQERKKKDTLRDITWHAVPLATTLAFQNGRLTITNNHDYKMYL